MSAYHPDEYEPLTFHDRVADFRDGSDTPRAYLERCLETIAAREPVVRAFVTLNIEGAREAADAATRRYREGRPLSAIDGMPVGIKDLLTTRDMPTKMGSPLYENNFPKQDSVCVQALREAGAIVLGKTVTTELGMSHPGPTTNPFDERRTPGGSSSGSAAAVGAKMIPAAIGTQVVGSIIRPGSFCANYAIKPTFGALHRGERQSFSQSHLGVHAGCMEDMWRVAAEIARRGGGDPGHPGLHGPAEPHEPLRPSRLVVVETEGWAGLDDASREAFERLLARLSAEGVAIVRRRENPLVEALERGIADSLLLCRDICAWELRWTLENLLHQHGGGLSESMMTRLSFARAMSLDDYRAALVLRDAARAALAAAASAGEAFISLSSAGPAPLKDNADMDSGVAHTTGIPSFNGWTSVLGAPAMTLPLLAVEGMPVGVQIMAQNHADHLLTGIGRWIAERAGARH